MGDSGRINTTKSHLCRFYQKMGLLIPSPLVTLGIDELVTTTGISQIEEKTKIC